MSLNVPTPSLDPRLPSMASVVRLRRLFAVSPALALAHAEQWLVRRMAHNGLLVTRFALGLIFLWFGLLKLLPGVAPIDVLAEKTLMMLTFNVFRPETCLHVLAGFECVIGLGLLTGRFVRVVLILLFFQMAGTFTPLILLHRETWIHFPYFPSFEGQYIIKNLVLISGGLIVGATVRGGRIIANPEIAAKAERVENAVEERAFHAKERQILKGAPQPAEVAVAAETVRDQARDM